MKQDYLDSGKIFYLEKGSALADFSSSKNNQNKNDKIIQKKCSFGADADYSIDSTIDYVNNVLKDYDCKKGDIIDFRMQDGWNEFPEMFINSVCDFTKSITKDRYIRHADDGYEDKITVFSCIYTGKHVDPKFNCDYDWATDQCIPN